jgi:hypothetical protein
MLFLLLDALVDGVNKLRRSLPGVCHSPTDVVALLTEQRIASPFASLERNLVMFLQFYLISTLVSTWAVSSPRSSWVSSTSESGGLFESFLYLVAPLPRSSSSTFCSIPIAVDNLLNSFL